MFNSTLLGDSVVKEPKVKETAKHPRPPAPVQGASMASEVLGQGCSRPAPRSAKFPKVLFLPGPVTQDARAPVTNADEDSPRAVLGVSRLSWLALARHRDPLQLTQREGRCVKDGERAQDHLGLPKC